MVVLRLVVGLLALTGCDKLLGLTTITPAVDASIDAPAAPPRAHYTFEQIGTAGPCLHDDTGNRHDGTCLLDAPTLVPGPPGHGNAFALDGNSYITVPYAADLDPTTGLTVAMWVALDGYDATRNIDCIINRPLGTTGQDSWQICAYPGGAFGVYGDASANMPGLTTGEWTHVVLVFDGSHTAAWVDGVLYSLNLTHAPAFDPSWGVWIGADAEPDPEVFLTGRIDELYIYDRVLSPDEIGALAR